MNGWCKSCGGINHEGHDLIEHCPDCGGIKLNSPHARADVTYRHCFCGTPKPKPAAPEITRTVAIEHAGEKIQIEVHVHLTQEEIDRIVLPAVLRSLSRQARRAGGLRARQA